jgi:hypothetical protein
MLFSSLYSMHTTIRLCVKPNIQVNHKTVKINIICWKLVSNFRVSARYQCQLPDENLTQGIFEANVRVLIINSRCWSDYCHVAGLSVFIMTLLQGTQFLAHLIHFCADS